MFHQFSQNDVAKISDALLCWFALNKRALPWRQHYTPYEVWISEVMLQQTQMERGVTYFERWMKRFPDIRAVAEASEEEILRYWEGLGYYRRARFLHQAAKIMQNQYNGQVPSSLKELTELPGLGAYTVAAILGIAYEQDIVSIDANVERVFSRLLNIDSSIKKQPAAGVVQREAQRFLPTGQARNYNQALMELGAVICGRTPKCPHCPLVPWCTAHKLGVEKKRPVTEPKKKIVPVCSAHGILIVEGHVLLMQRDVKGLWGGMWEFPGVTVEKRSPNESLTQFFSKQLGLDVEIVAPLGTVQHNYTNHKLTSYFFRLMTESPLTLRDISAQLGAVPHCFVPWNATADLAMPAHHRKMAERYFSGKQRLKAEQLSL